MSLRPEEGVWASKGREKNVWGDHYILKYLSNKSLQLFSSFRKKVYEIFKIICIASYANEDKQEI